MPSRSKTLNPGLAVGHVRRYPSDIPLTRGCLKGYNPVTEQIKVVISCLVYGKEGFLFGNVVDYCILIRLFARW